MAHLVAQKRCKNNDATATTICQLPGSARRGKHGRQCGAMRARALGRVACWKVAEDGRRMLIWLLRNDARITMQRNHNMPASGVSAARRAWQAVRSDVRTRSGPRGLLEHGSPGAGAARPLSRVFYFVGVLHTAAAATWRGRGRPPSPQGPPPTPSASLRQCSRAPQQWRRPSTKS
jgi:hypothetical protein